MSNVLSQLNFSKIKHKIGYHFKYIMIMVPSLSNVIAILVLTNISRLYNNVCSQSCRRSCWQGRRFSGTLILTPGGGRSSLSLSLTLGCWGGCGCWCIGSLRCFGRSFFCLLFLFLLLWFFCGWETALLARSHGQALCFGIIGENVVYEYIYIYIWASAWYEFNYNWRIRAKHEKGSYYFRLCMFFSNLLIPLLTRPSHLLRSIFYFWISFSSF